MQIDSKKADESLVKRLNTLTEPPMVSALGRIKSNTYTSLLQR